jgi:sortase A
MKKLLTGIIFLLILFAGANFGIKAIHSLENRHSAEPSVNLISNNNQETAEDEKPAPGTPKTLSIPKIKVNATIESVGLDPERKMDVPKDSDNVAWYNLGPKPGSVGSAVIAGHKDEASGAPSVFWDLKNLETGDEIIVTDGNGNDYTYSVIDKKEYPDAAFPLQKVFNTNGKPYLNLITCEGVFNKSTRNYSHRTVVYSELVD